VKSLIGILTYRRLEPLKAMLAQVQQHCSKHDCLVMEDCGQRDGTYRWLTVGRTAVPCPDLLASKHVPKENAEVNFPQVTVYTGDVNLGVAGNSNRILKVFMDGDWDHLCLCNDDLEITGDFVNFYAQAHQDLGLDLFCFCDFDQPSPAISGPVETYRWTSYPVRGYVLKLLPRFTGIMMSMTRSLVERIGYFDVEFGKFGEEHPCPGNSLVLMADGTHRPLADIKLGDYVVGWTKFKSGCVTSDRLVKSKVTGIVRLVRKLVKVTLESGNIIYCAPEHTWLDFKAPVNCPPHKKYVKAEVGRVLTRVLDNPTILDKTISKFFPYTYGKAMGILVGAGKYSAGKVLLNKKVIPDLAKLLDIAGINYYQSDAQDLVVANGTNYLIWEPKDKIQTCGWLAGIYAARKNGLGFSVSNFPVKGLVERLQAALKETEFETVEKDGQLNFKNGLSDLCRLKSVLGISGDEDIDYGSVRAFKNADQVVEVTELPDEVPVYCLRTTTGNYIINGYASKNCDFTIRARMAGGIRYEQQDLNCVDVEHNLLRHMDIPTSFSGTLRKAADEKAAKVMARAAKEYKMRHYYRPYRLIFPEYGGACYYTGISCRQLEQVGYKVIGVPCS
jgi:hypothetical protein